MDVPENVVSKAANRIATATKMGIRVWWIDKVLGEIGVKRDHSILLHEARLLELDLKSFIKIWIKWSNIWWS